MERSEALAPCFIHSGTVSSHIDVMRALDTVEGFRFRQLVDGEVVAEGSATLVKLSADDTATMLVNGCLFLNVASFRYLTFETTAEGCLFVLHGDGVNLEIVPSDEGRPGADNAERLIARDVFGAGSYVASDDDESEQ
jgi:hypothetical protein